MNRLRHLGIMLVVLVSLFFLFLLFSGTAYASIDGAALDQAVCAYYIDPGTGSIIIQFVIGSFLGLLAVAGVYRVRIRNFLARLFTRRRRDREGDENKQSEESK